MRVALTFDTEHPDGPSHTVDGLERILGALADARVTGTFFLQGRWALAYPDLARRIADEGHLVGSHSHYHYRMSGYTRRQIRDDLQKAEDAILATAGKDPKPWFRLPFHSGNDVARVVRAIRSAGYEQVFRNCDPGDWEPAATAPEIVEEVARQAGEKELVVVDLHNWPRVTSEALPDIIGYFAERGCEFVTVNAFRDQLTALRKRQIT
jgi:peptidoglycan-N-acetylglucosamine deacetylase